METLELTIEYEDQAGVSWEVVSQEPEPGPLKRRLSRVGRGAASLAEWLFGVASLIVGLSVLAALPILQFSCMGYFLESSARVARSGRWRDGLIGVRKAARIGGILLGFWICSLPVWFTGVYARSAALVAPGGTADRGWRVALIALTVATLMHIGASLARGGRLRHFLWPVGSLLWWLKRPWKRGAYAELRDQFWAFVSSYRPWNYFKIGLIGFIGTVAWLIPPAVLISMGGKFPLVAVIGAFWLAWVVTFLPFLQVRYGVEGHWRALLNRKAVRERFRRAPWAFAFSLAVLLIASIPLYLLKIEMVPREAAWLPALVFVHFLAPARILIGWAYARSGRRDQPRHWLFRIVGRLAIVPVALLYVLVVVLSQHTSWAGTGSLFEQHAFLLPVPFLGN